MADQEIGKIDEMVLRSTVKIITSANTFGTGFIISVPSINDKRYFFLVTNKHLVGEYSVANGIINNFYDYLIIYFYKKDNAIQKINIPLKNKEGKLNINRVIIHPEPDVDIAVLPIADALAIVDEKNRVSLDISMLPTIDDLKKWFIDIGDQVFALGYPFDIYSLSNNYPIAKSGYISSKIGEDSIVKVKCKDEHGNLVTKLLKGKIILLDGTFVGGNSGGPVIIPRGIRQYTDRKTNKIKFSTVSVPNFIIGIQSQSITDAGISLAFSSEYIVQLINDIIKKIKVSEQKNATQDIEKSEK